MRRLFVIFFVLAALIGGAMFWFAQYAENNPAQTGKQTIEVDIHD